jgi:hypothetical protein
MVWVSFTMVVTKGGFTFLERDRAIVRGYRISFARLANSLLYTCTLPTSKDACGCNRVGLDPARTAG